MPLRGPPSHLSHAERSEASVPSHDSRLTTHDLPRIPRGDLIPADDIEPRRNVVGALILVFQIVSVLPHIKAKDRCLAVHQRRILVRRARNTERAAVRDQPGPATSET